MIDRPVTTSVVVPASREDVWEAISEPARLSEWFGADVVELELKPGGRIVFREHDGTLRRALVESVEPGVRVVFRWLPMEQHADGSLTPVARTSVSLTIEDDPDGTRVTVTEAPIAGGVLIAG